MSQGLQDNLPYPAISASSASASRSANFSPARAAFMAFSSSSISCLSGPVHPTALQLSWQCPPCFHPRTTKVWAPCTLPENLALREHCRTNTQGHTSQTPLECDDDFAGKPAVFRFNSQSTSCSMGIYWCILWNPENLMSLCQREQFVLRICQSKATTVKWDPPSTSIQDLRRVLACHIPWKLPPLVKQGTCRFSQLSSVQNPSLIPLYW